jgi:excisionase family DNA binding protein
VATTPVYQPRETETAEIQELHKLFLRGKAPALVAPDGHPIPIPESIYNILLQVVGYMTQGKAVSVIPVMQELTTQQAANMLGVSRPFLVSLLNADQIPFHKTGTHRRIYLKDLMDYMTRRDQNRKRILGEIAKNAAADGDYDQMHVPDDGQ